MKNWRDLPPQIHGNLLVEYKSLTYRKLRIFVRSNLTSHFLATNCLSTASIRHTGRQVQLNGVLSPTSRTSAPLWTYKTPHLVRQGPISGIGAPQPSTLRTHGTFLCACLAERTGDGIPGLETNGNMPIFTPIKWIWNQSIPQICAPIFRGSSLKKRESIIIYGPPLWMIRR